MGPAPLLVPSIVTLALASIVGTFIALKQSRPSVLAAALSGAVPALTTWIAVLRAPLGEWTFAPILVFLAGLQIGLLVVVALIPVRSSAGFRLAAVGVACALAVATLATGAWRARAGGHAWAPSDCQMGYVSNLSDPFVGDGVNVRGGSEYEQGAPPPGLRCIAYITMSSGATRRQKLLELPHLPSGSVVCDSVGVLWCPRAQVLVVEGSAYQGEDLAVAPTTFGGNLARFGVPSSYLLFNLLAAAAACVIFASEARRSSRRRRGAVPGPTHPYRAGTPDVSIATEDRRGTALAFIAIVVALTGAAPLATVLASG